MKTPVSANQLLNNNLATNTPLARRNNMVRVSQTLGHNKPLPAAHPGTITLYSPANAWTRLQAFEAGASRPQLVASQHNEMHFRPAATPFDKLTPAKALRGFYIATTCAVGQLAALPNENRAIIFQSLLSFVGAAKSLRGLESVYLTGMSAMAGAGYTKLHDQGVALWQQYAGSAAGHTGVFYDPFTQFILAFDGSQLGQLNQQFATTKELTAALASISARMDMGWAEALCRLAVTGAGAYLGSQVGASKVGWATGAEAGKIVCGWATDSAPEKDPGGSGGHGGTLDNDNPSGPGGVDNGASGVGSGSSGAGESGPTSSEQNQTPVGERSTDSGNQQQDDGSAKGDSDGSGHPDDYPNPEDYPNPDDPNGWRVPTFGLLNAAMVSNQLRALSTGGYAVSGLPIYATTNGLTKLASAGFMATIPALAEQIRAWSTVGFKAQMVNQTALREGVINSKTIGQAKTRF